MKSILKKIIKEQILKEDLGVSRSTIPYTNICFHEIKPHVLQFLDDRKKFEKSIVIPLNKLKKVYSIDPDNFIEFPIEEIHISLDFKTTKKPQIKNRAPFFVGGNAHHIGQKHEALSYLKKPNKNIPDRLLAEVERTLIATFDISITLYPGYDESFEDELIYSVRDTLFHEFNHMYDFYQRHFSGSEVDTILAFAGEKNRGIPKQIFNVWLRFLNYIYYSEPYELNAMTQEMYSYRLRHDFEQLKSHIYWKYADLMENFDADLFYRYFIDTIEKYDPEYVDSVLKRVHNWFISDYKEAEKPKSSILNTKNAYQLLKLFEPRIKKAGKKLKRRFSRLYSIQTD